MKFCLSTSTPSWLRNNPNQRLLMFVFLDLHHSPPHPDVRIIRQDPLPIYFHSLLLLIIHDYHLIKQLSSELFIIFLLKVIESFVLPVRDAFSSALLLNIATVNSLMCLMKSLS